MHNLDSLHAVPSGPSTAPPFQDFVKGLWKENPVFAQMLGMCPTMAITNSVTNALAMGLATTFVLLGSGVFVSLFRKRIANEVRITTYILIIAAFVQIADMGLEATMPVSHKALGPFIALIVANCLLLARQESFSARNGVWRSTLDAMGMGLGFTLGLSVVGSVREILGQGSWLGIRVMPASFEPWVIMNLPPGGFFSFGFVLLGLAWWNERQSRRAKRRIPVNLPATEPLLERAAS
ncbi:MAG: electron transport complex subunit RsxE [Gemmatimonadaceae bacterium]